MQGHRPGVYCVVVLSSLMLSACASQQLKLDMEREPPVIESLTTEPAGQMDTRGQDQTVKVVMHGDPGLKGTVDAAVGADHQQIALKEAEPGTYEGSFSVPAGKQGTVNLTGHLRHEPSGAQQDLQKNGILQLVESAPPPPPSPAAAAEGASGVAGQDCPANAASQLQSRLQALTVHFDFNQATLRPDAIQSLRQAG